MGDSVHVWLAPAGAEPRSAAHNLLVQLAGTLITAPVLHHDPDGRPRIPGLAVSISHTHRLLAVAASYDGPLGVDVEEAYPREVRGLALRWFDPVELEWMAAQPDELTAFLQLWTAKEAVGKALGQGLRNSGLRRRMPLPTFSAEGAPPAGLVGGEAGLAVLHVPAEQAILAVALPSTAPEVVVSVHQEAALRRVVRSRTSFPVVVRGN
ncbi:MAG TPA: 4'-phosphopantetheinyl transferase superfamily protein [Kribbella sp.]|nr:4'-phosphopantetheinyl transferase superfamily protein [Kribbella sp.]